MNERIMSAARINTEALRNAYYPGRGIVMGMAPSGEALIQIYWTMGRSKNSRNRILAKENGDVYTRVRDEGAGMKNAELNLYRASAVAGSSHIVTNGRQTDTVCDHLKRGGSLFTAQNEWEFETDGPIYTTRISGVLRAGPGGCSCDFGLIQAAEREPGLLTRKVCSYSGFVKGAGLCVHTYSLNEVCFPFKGEPYWVVMPESLDEAANFFWDILDPEMRVGLYAKRINAETGGFEDIVLSI